MLVVESDACRGHYPHWVFRLGGEQYKTKDVPSRVQAIRRALARDGDFEFLGARRFPERHIAGLHPYFGFIKKTSRSIEDPKVEHYPDLFPGEGARLPRRTRSPLWAGLYCTDAVTPIMMHTFDAARGSAECALTGADLLRKGSVREVYALCRPSGHHAGPRVFGGYCYFNNSAVAAEFLRASGKVAVVDIDYHHGNGTQEFFQERKDVFTSSIHGDPDVEYPYFWGYADERGIGQAIGTNLNLPLPLGTSGEIYLEAVDQAIASIQDYAPEFLIVGAGFDTHAADPIGGFALTEETYPEIGRRLGALGLPTLVCQEGGYNTDVLGACVLGFLQGLLRGRVRDRNAT